MLKDCDVTLILNGYNEGKGLLSNLNIVQEILEDTRYSWEILLIDDVSNDNTLRTFRKFAYGKKNIRVIAHKKRAGRGASVVEGIIKGRGKVVGFLDTDLELSPIYLPEFVRQINTGNDVAIATRIYAVGGSNFIRAIISRGYVFLIHLLLGIKLKDTEAGFKFFNKNAILSLAKESEYKHWFWDTEIIAKSYWS